nr:hypothetical protein [Tanacetum cinerariifolium]
MDRWYLYLDITCDVYGFFHGSGLGLLGLSPDTRDCYQQSKGKSGQSGSPAPHEEKPDGRVDSLATHCCLVGVLELVPELVLLLEILGGVCVVGLLDYGVSDVAQETLFVALGGVATLNQDFATMGVASNLLDFAATCEAFLGGKSDFSELDLEDTLEVEGDEK